MEKRTVPFSRKAEKESAAKQREDIEKANEEGRNNKYGVQEVKDTIERTHVTTTEVNNSEKSIAERNEMRRLQSMKNRLTLEQQARLAELENIYLNGKNKKRGNLIDKVIGMKIGMSL